MNMKKRLTTCLLAILCIGCSTNEYEHSLSAEKQITLMPIITKASKLNFTAGEKVGLTIRKEDESQYYAENVQMTYDGEIFAADDDLTWYAEGSESAKMMAYYPYDPDGTPTQFSIQADQNGEGYDASDFMTSVKENTLPTANSVLMPFEHKLSGIAISVENYAVQSDGVSAKSSTGDEYEIESITIKGVYSGIIYDIEENSITTDEESEKIDITANKVSSTEFYIVLPPQKSSFEVVATTVGGESVSQTLTPSSIESGYQYSLSVVLFTDSFEISLSGGIKDWEDGGDLTFEDDDIIDDEGTWLKPGTNIGDE